MPFIEAPTNFYLGRQFNPRTKHLEEDVVYYDSRDLTTHAVVVGMTGSGKTGLCISLLEEAILDNIPAIIVDPKGDITNLLLHFPELAPQDFQPWVNVDDAHRAGLSVPEYSADVARRWKEGLGNWGIVPDRLRWLSIATQYNIYTPGSDAGLPISILASLKAPRDGWAGNEEAHRERINGIVTALLALIGINAKPVEDAEHVLIANIFEYAWSRGQDLTLQDIILQIQKPPFSNLGVFPIDEYISERKRRKLAVDMNNIVAAPSFQSWINGEPMDVQRLLYRPDGRPKVSIFYIAHLSESERQFIITLLLENMLAWMRTLSGTTSLRALLYIDEMFGYFPPFPRNPPTKEPMLRLLKQARAFGLGLILATQNPGDLDYKGLSNAGTWFIGRLQSENDRNRVMSGLHSLATVDDSLNIKEVERLVADIEPRVFLMHNVHNDAGPVLVHTRWAMNYLRGPLTRQQVSTLMGQRKQQLTQQLAQEYVAQGAGYVGSAATGYHSAPQSPPRFADTNSPMYNTPPRQQAPMPPSTVPGMPAPPPSLPGFPDAPPSLPENPTSPVPPATNFENFTPVPGHSPQYFQDTGATVPPSQANLGRPGGPGATTPGGEQLPPGFSPNQPPLSASTTQYFLPHRLTSQQAISQWEQRTSFTAQSIGTQTLAYRPVLLAQAVVRYSDRKTRIFTARTYAYHIPNLERAGLVHWEEYNAQPIDARTIAGEPFTEAIFGDLPSGLTDSKRLTALKRELTDLLYSTAHLKVPFNPELKIYGDPDADYSEFRAQTQQLARERRDEEIDALTKKYEGILDKLEDKMRDKASRLSAEKQELAERKREELFTTGEAIFGLLRGRTQYTLSRMSRASLYRKQSRSDLNEFERELAEIQDEAVEAEQEFEQLLRETNDKWARIAAEAEEYMITPYKKDIQLELFGIGWVPYWFMMINGQPALIHAFA